MYEERLERLVAFDEYKLFVKFGKYTRAFSVDYLPLDMAGS